MAAFTWFNELSFEDMLKRVAALPPRSAILFALLSVDAAGVPHEEGKALTSLHAVANAPIFSYDDGLLRPRNCGGPLIPLSTLSAPTNFAANSTFNKSKLGSPAAFHAA